MRNGAPTQPPPAARSFLISHSQFRILPNLPLLSIELRELAGRVWRLETALDIESVGFGGAGVGHLADGQVCFVPLTLPGERVLVRVSRSKKSFCEAELVRLLEASIRRTPPGCPLFGRCGGCAYQHASYDLQLEIKTSQVRELLSRMGGIPSPDVRPMLGSPLQWGYRNRLAVHVQDGEVGFHGKKSNRLVPADRCPIASEAVNGLLAELAAAPPRGDQRVTLRESSGVFGFSQVNSAAAEILAEVVGRMAPDGLEHLVDAYGGAGFFGKRLMGKFRRVTGIEWSAGAVEAARRDALPGETYLEGAVEVHLAGALALAPAEATALVVDPPAEGLTAEVIAAILANPPAAIIYVSCDPPTLARDLKRLGSRFVLDHVQPVDMFPQTAEIEAVALLKLSSL